MLNFPSKNSQRWSSHSASSFLEFLKIMVLLCSMHPILLVLTVLFGDTFFFGSQTVFSPSEIDNAFWSNGIFSRWTINRIRMNFFFLPVNQNQPFTGSGGFVYNQYSLHRTCWLDVGRICTVEVQPRRLRPAPRTISVVVECRTLVRPRRLGPTPRTRNTHLK